MQNCAFFFFLHSFRKAKLFSCLEWFIALYIHL